MALVRDDGMMVSQGITLTGKCRQTEGQLDEEKFRWNSVIFAEFLISELAYQSMQQWTAH